jgi:hypothetical protein
MLCKVDFAWSYFGDMQGNESTGSNAGAAGGGLDRLIRQVAELSLARGWRRLKRKHEVTFL